MHDIRFIRDNPEAFDAGLARRGLPPMASDLIALDERRRVVITALQEKQTRRNEASKEMGYLRSGQKNALGLSGKTLAEMIAIGAEAIDAPRRMEKLQEELQVIKSAIPLLEASERDLDKELRNRLAEIPNLPLSDVPYGTEEAENEIVHNRGHLPNLSFHPQEHDAIGPALGMDFETGVALAGSRFTLLRGPIAKLNRALGQFMLDTMTAMHGYEECVPPLMVRDEAVFGTGQLPKFSDDLFKTLVSFDQEAIRQQVDAAVDEAWDEYKDELPESAWQNARQRVKINAVEGWKRAFEGNSANRRWLIPTAEVSLTNIVRESILSEEKLPLRFTALTPCFRSEAGAAGRDTRGLIRQHQFEKVEMVSITTPDQSEDEHERMTACAEDILTRLGLAFRRMKLCTGDMGFSAARTYDLEVWLPGQGRYREISSCSTCTDFQARRMNARYRAADGKPAFVHTLNGSGLAVGRTLVAVVENYQQADGSVAIPDALQPYLKGLNRLEPKA